MSLFLSDRWNPLGATQPRVKRGRRAAAADAQTDNNDNTSDQDPTRPQQETLFQHLKRLYRKVLAPYSDARFVVTNTLVAVLSFISAYFFTALISDYLPDALTAKRSKTINGLLGVGFLGLSLGVMYLGVRE